MQQFGCFGMVLRNHIDAHRGLQRLEALHEQRQQHHLAVVGQHQVELARAPGAVEAGLAPQGLVQIAQDAIDVECEFVRARRGLDRTPIAQEQRIVEQMAHARQGAAHGRLAHARLLGGAREAARLVDGVEEGEQIEIDCAQAHGADSSTWCMYRIPTMQWC